LWYAAVGRKAKKEFVVNGNEDAETEIPASRNRTMKLRKFDAVRRVLAAVVLAVGIMATPFDALAGPIDVTFVATPEFSDLLLNFSVTNNIGAGVEIWSFGVSISSGQDIPSFGIPPGWADAGPGIPYNNNWTTDPTGPYTILFGETLGGFIARDSDWSPPSGDFFTLVAPTWLADGPDTIDWIALTIDGTGNRGSMTGTASNEASVPEPSSLMMLCAGLGMLGITRLRCPCGHR
jgi:hypothetical protein